MKRRFIDASADDRCRWTVLLSDRSAAQCGRRKVRGDLCTQHAKMLLQWSCDYCGGSDELPPDHTIDCSRPKEPT
jgi:hypothetical protein